ncbi:YhcH/YjgK/YiaL family protein [Paenibacillus sp. SI8]|uniref:YhcH/YjgK/YiaL family protein n=1 Tax=unclassified Paenibacillus TaxID=185978 RepID=UPI0034664B03
MYAIVMEFTSKLTEGTLAEKHETFLDIHYLLEGAETIGWALDVGQAPPVEDFLKERDYALYDQVHGEQRCQLTPGSFMILFPSDIHCPGLSVHAPEQIRKVVIKINKALFLLFLLLIGFSLYIWYRLPPFSGLLGKNTALSLCPQFFMLC